MKLPDRLTFSNIRRIHNQEKKDILDNKGTNSKDTGKNKVGRTEKTVLVSAEV